MAKLAMISLGCAKNQVNSEQMLHLLVQAGHKIVADPNDAEVAVVNTCGFIDAAKSEAIDHILELGSMKHPGGLERILVTGCLSQRYGKEILGEMPEVDGVLGTGSYWDIVPAVDKVLSGEQVSVFGDINAPIPEAERLITTPSSWAYLKIAEGCDHRCAFCVIPSIRGKYRSRPMEKVLEEARELVKRGARELIVVAQDITRYGIDLYKERRLPELLLALSEIPDLKWIRLHYLYPDALSDRLIQVIRDEYKILNYLDIPIQHINDRLLRSMKRRSTGDQVRTLITKLRSQLPGLVLRTSLIVGLPGEGEAELDELAAFLEQYRIERAGVFVYSPEEGTEAEQMPNRPPTEEAQLRAQRLMNIQAGVMEQFTLHRLGSEDTVLCEGYDTERRIFYGRSYAESPDIDGVIWLQGEDLILGEFYRVRYTDDIDGEIVGTVLAVED